MPKKVKKTKKVKNPKGVKVSQVNKQTVNIILSDLKKAKKRRKKKKGVPKNPVLQGVINNQVNNVFAEYMRAMNIKANTDLSLKMREIAADVKMLEAKERNLVLNELKKGAVISGEQKAIQSKRNQPLPPLPPKPNDSRKRKDPPKIEEISDDKAKKVKVLDENKYMAPKTKDIVENYLGEGKEKLNKLHEKTSKEGRGLYDYEINEIMENIPNWKGVHPSDKLIDLTPSEDMNIVVNLDTSQGKGTHWVAIRFDSKSKSAEYYDSFGRDPQHNIDKAIKDHIDTLDLDHMWRYKINRKKTQDLDSKLCGYHCIMFLLSRETGQDFKTATNFNEKDVEDGMKVLKFKLI